MDFLVELIGEIFLEGILEVIRNKNISKWIRYPLFIFINALYLVILGIFLIISIKLFIKKEILGGVVMLFILFLLLILYICFFRKLLKK